jgi:hypothetical protein
MAEAKTRILSARGASRYLTALERRALLIRRPWTPEERHIVVQGFWGRAAIAIEPALGSLVFFALTVGMIVRGLHAPDGMAGPACIAGIFFLGFLGFVAYGIGLMFAPFRALVSTRQPIFIVDGYLRSRPPDARSEEESAGYVAVLTADSDVAYEWSAHGETPLEHSLQPVHVEFSEYGGIHKIDGKSTGVLPAEMTTLSVGLSSPRITKLSD